MRWFCTFLLLLTLVATAGPVADAWRGPRKPPSRASFERRMAAVSRDLFGDDPFQLESDSASDSSRELYWGRARPTVTVEYDSAGRVETVHLSTFDGLATIEPIAIRLVSPTERGRFLRRKDESPPNACLSFGVDEFESVVVGTSQYGCQGSIPAGIVISWNKNTVFPWKN